MVDFRIEVVAVPVSDVDRVKDFYPRIGFGEDVDFSGPDGFRVVHLTPPGSAASIIIGSGVTDAEPGSERGVHLVVDDVVAARAERSEYEGELGHPEPDGPAWYAAHMAGAAGLGD